MNLCFSTLGCTERNLPDVLSLCEKYRIKYLEIRGISGELDCRKIREFSSENIKNTLDIFKKLHIEPLIIGTSCSFHKAENYENAVDEGKASIAIASKLGAGAIRIFGDCLTSDSPQRIIKGIHTLCEFAHNTNVSVLLEVHGDFNTAENLSPLLKEFRNESHFGLIWDVEHTNKTYGDNWLEFYSVALPFIRHVHIKDADRSGLVQIGEGIIPLRSIIRQMISDGYNGAFSLEWEKKWHPELPPIETALERFISLVNTIDDM